MRLRGARAHHVTWDSRARRALIACAGGELWAMDGGGANELRTLQPDLRDVWTDEGGLAVSRFRAAEVLRVTADAPPITPPRAELPSPASAGSPFVARVAWRTVAGPTGTGSTRAWARSCTRSEARYTS